MGIKDFKKIFPVSKLKTKTEVYNQYGKNNSRIGIDLMSILWTANAANNGKLTNSNGDPTMHLTSIFNNIIEMKKKGIRPLYVLDSNERNEYKEAECNKRNENTNRLVPTTEMINETIELINAMGVPVYKVENPLIEGECLLALLNREHIIEAVISNDMDVIMWGGRTLISKSKGNATKFEVIEYDDVINYADPPLSHDELIKICISVGTDFYPSKELHKIPKIGVKSAIKKGRDVVIPEEFVKFYNYIKDEKLTSEELQNIEFPNPPVNIEKIKYIMIECNECHKTVTDKKIEIL